MNPVTITDGTGAVVTTIDLDVENARRRALTCSNSLVAAFPETPAVKVAACRCGKYTGPDRPRIESANGSFPWRCDVCGTGTDDHPFRGGDDSDWRCYDCDRRHHSHGAPRWVRRFTVHTFVNCGPGMFWGYKPGDALRRGPDLVVEVDEDRKPHAVFGETSRNLAAMYHEALDKAWEVGNRMGTDSEDAAWPSDVRSLSVGDVLVIDSGIWSVDSFGFEAVGHDALDASLDPSRREVREGFSITTLEVL